MPLARRTSILGLAAAIGVASLAIAQTQPAAADRPHARPSLVADAKSIQPGRPFTVAVRFQMDPSWHVYWKDPGDSGLPPSVKWRLPPGYTAGELQFPTPEVIKGDAGVNYVYHDDVALLVEITPPKNAQLGDAVTIAGDLRWLECDVNQCLAKRGSVETHVAVAASAEPNEPGLFTAWRDKVKAAASFDPKRAAAEAKPTKG